MLTVEQRAVAVLAAAGQTADSRAASGRYLRSGAIRPGVRFWATSRLRQREDLFGAQFHGEGRKEAARLRSAFERAGFEVRNPETSKITFARLIPFGLGETVDVNAVEAARRDVETILGQTAPTDIRKMSFREFMLASPLAGLELELPERTIDPEGPNLF